MDFSRATAISKSIARVAADGVLKDVIDARGFMKTRPDVGGLDGFFAARLVRRDSLEHYPWAALTFGEDSLKRGENRVGALPAGGDAIALSVVAPTFGGASLKKIFTRGFCRQNSAVDSVR